MFLFPALTIGFLFVAVPLLVHLINMLRHRRQPWAAMDFLLASHRKQKKWIVFRQMLLLLCRLALAALLIAMLAGWSGGRQLFRALGGTTVHHFVVLDDSYSMSDASGGSTAYEVALQTLSDLTRQMASEDGEHQLTLIRASRATLSNRTGNTQGDVAADLSAQTIDLESRLIDRVMSTKPSPMRTDISAALEMTVELMESSNGDEKFLYILSDFRQRDWAQPEKYSEQLRALESESEVKLVDCSQPSQPNLAITALAPQPDVWVAGVPVVMDVSVKNLGNATARNVAMSVQLVLYDDTVTNPDPAKPESGTVESLPALIIEELGAGSEITKSFQVFVPQPGNHAIQVALADDALLMDNRRTCTLPLTDSEKVLVIDDDPDGLGSYHIESVLNPGSQVRIGAIPETQPASFLRGLSSQDMSAYRAIYLVDVPRIEESVADALSDYVKRGGGVAWFLGEKVDRVSYNQTLPADDRMLLPGPLDSVVPLQDQSAGTPSLRLGDSPQLMSQLAAVGDGVFGLVGLTKSWTLSNFQAGTNGMQSRESVDRVSENREEDAASGQGFQVELMRSDGLPFVTSHDFGQGRVVTVMSGLDGQWTNWPGDPTFVVFLLQTNATLWSAASLSTSRLVDEPIVRTIPNDTYSDNAVWLPATESPPRLPIEFEWSDVGANEDPTVSPDAPTMTRLVLSPEQWMTSDKLTLDDLWSPGLAELVLTQLDGQTEVQPIATNLDTGESDLARTNHAELIRDLQPASVRFVDAGQWGETANRAGTSTLILVLLAVLAALFAAEQALASWASYHSTGSTNADANLGRSRTRSNAKSTTSKRVSVAESTRGAT